MNTDFFLPTCTRCVCILGAAKLTTYKYSINCLLVYRESLPLDFAQITIGFILKVVALWGRPSLIFKFYCKKVIHVCITFSKVMSLRISRWYHLYIIPFDITYSLTGKMLQVLLLGCSFRNSFPTTHVAGNINVCQLQWHVLELFISDHPTVLTVVEHEVHVNVGELIWGIH